MNIYKKEVKDHLKQAFGWIFGAIFLVWVGMMKFQGLNESTMKINDLIASLPRAIRAVMGGSNFDLNTAGGFFGVIFTYLLVMAAIYASHLGSEVINKEELYHTSEFLFGKPIERRSVLYSKMAAALTHLLIFNGVTYLVSVLAISVYDSTLPGPLFQSMLFLISIQAFFFGFSMFISAKLKSYRRANQVCQIVILITFLISLLVDMDENLSYLSYATPFRYQDLGSLLLGSPLQWFPWLILVGLASLLILLAVKAFDQHDLLI